MTHQEIFETLVSPLILLAQSGMSEDRAKAVSELADFVTSLLDTSIIGEGNKNVVYRDGKLTLNGSKRSIDPNVVLPSATVPLMDE